MAFLQTLRYCIVLLLGVMFGLFLSYSILPSQWRIQNLNPRDDKMQFKASTILEDDAKNLPFIQGERDLPKWSESDNKVIHFIYGLWDPGEIPDSVHEIVKSWIDVNPKFTTKIWTRSHIETLITDEYIDVMRIWKGSPAIFQSDIARLLIIHRFGGVYVDLDVSPFNIIKCLQWQSTKQVQLFVDQLYAETWVLRQRWKREIKKMRKDTVEYNIRIANYAFAAISPGGKIFESTLRLIETRIEYLKRMRLQNWDESYITLFTTGPDMLTEATFGVRYPKEHNEKYDDWAPIEDVDIIARRADCIFENKNEGSWKTSKAAKNMN